MAADPTSPTFTDAERRLLALVLDAIIPPSEDGRLPGAGEAGVGAHVEDALRSLPDLRAMVAQGLGGLDEAARSRHGHPFGELPRGTRQALLAEQGFVFPLTLHAFVGYYQTARVVEALGMEPRPPHPKGYTMAPNDLTLLEPVRRRPKLYRDC